tara:strand:+ start:636 stop:851 length:216 start_codon:yes stop_codon:yes gene_type:complete
MKNILIVMIISIFAHQNLFANEEKCRDLSDKPIEYSKCIAKFGKDLGEKGFKKLNTDSKLTDWIKNKMGNK